MVKPEFLDDDDIEYMTDLLLDTSMSLTEIAKELNCSIQTLNKKINQHGLTWLKKSHKKREIIIANDLFITIIPIFINGNPVASLYCQLIFN